MADNPTGPTITLRIDGQSAHLKTFGIERLADYLQAIGVALDHAPVSLVAIDEGSVKLQLAVEDVAVEIPADLEADARFEPIRKLLATDGNVIHGAFGPDVFKWEPNHHERARPEPLREHLTLIGRVEAVGGGEQARSWLHLRTDDGVRVKCRAPHDVAAVASARYRDWVRLTGEGAFEVDEEDLAFRLVAMDVSKIEPLDPERDPPAAAFSRLGKLLEDFPPEELWAALDEARSD